MTYPATAGWLARGLPRAGAGLGLRLLMFSTTDLVSGLAGMSVSVLVMLVQIGLLTGILHSQSLVATLVRGDLVAMNRARANLHQWSDVDPIRLRQIAAVRGVERVVPIYEGGMGLRQQGSHAIRRIIAFAFPPGDAPLDIGDPNEIRAALAVPGAVLFDRRSRDIYGAVRAGQDVELDGRLHRVAGFVTIGADIVNDGAVVMREGSWLSAHGASSHPLMAAVYLSRGASLDALRARILSVLPGDVTLMTPREVVMREMDFTMRSAPIGLLFGIGVLAGLVIGAITCYQVLFHLIMDRLHEYATLRGMGFSDTFLRYVVMLQAVALALPSFGIGLLASYACYAWLEHKTSLTIPHTLSSPAAVLLLTLAMSLLAGRIAMRKLAIADPAALY